MRPDLSCKHHAAEPRLRTAPRAWVLARDRGTSGSRSGDLESGLGSATSEPSRLWCSHLQNRDCDACSEKLRKCP